MSDLETRLRDHARRPFFLLVDDATHHDLLQAADALALLREIEVAHSIPCPSCSASGTVKAHLLNCEISRLLGLTVKEVNVP